MNKYMKIGISVVLAIMIYAVGYINIKIITKYDISSVMYWLITIVIAITIALPVLKHWFNYVSKKLWNVSDSKYTSIEVKEVLVEFMDLTMSKKMNSSDEFKQWLKSKGL